MTQSLPKQPFADELTDRQRELLHRFSDWIVQHRMTTPAVLFLESVRPLNYVGSQVMVFFQPVVYTVFKLPEWDELRLVLEQRESVSFFLDLIEEKEAQWLEQKRLEKIQQKKAQADLKEKKIETT